MKDERRIRRADLSTQGLPEGGDVADLVERWKAEGLSPGDIRAKLDELASQAEPIQPAEEKPKDSPADARAAEVKDWRETKLEIELSALANMKPGRDRDEATGAFFERLTEAFRLARPAEQDRIKRRVCSILKIRNRTLESELRSFRKPDDRDQAPASNTVARVVALVSEGAEFFHEPGEAGAPYIIIRRDGHRENLRIRSDGFRQHVRNSWYVNTKEGLGNQTVQDIVETLAAKASLSSAVETRIRVAGNEDVVYLDLGGEDWAAVEITPAGWEIIPEAPTAFIRGRGSYALPKPERGGSIEDLKPFVNIRPEDWPLLLGWLMGAFRPRGPYPILAVTGEHGSAKSTFCRLVRSLVDPNKLALASLPKEERDLAVNAMHRWVIGFDNVSRIPDWLSDALCRVATGGGFFTRSLYSDGEESLFDFTRPLILNGIAPHSAKEDLPDRFILLDLPSIPKAGRREEREILPAFESARPKILGALLDAVSVGLRRLPDVRLNELPRMADFATWAVACEAGLGLGAGAFMERYLASRNAIRDDAIESSLIGIPLLKMMAGQAEIELSPTDLLEGLKEAAGLPEDKKRPDGWPAGPHVLTPRIKRIAPILREMGLDVNFPPPDRRGRRIKIVNTHPDLGRGEWDKDCPKIEASQGDNEANQCEERPCFPQ